MTWKEVPTTFARTAKLCVICAVSFSEIKTYEQKIAICKKWRVDVEYFDAFLAWLYPDMVEQLSEKRQLALPGKDHGFPWKSLVVILCVFVLLVILGTTK